MFGLIVFMLIYFKNNLIKISNLPTASYSNSSNDRYIDKFKCESQAFKYYFSVIVTLIIDVINAVAERRSSITSAFDYSLNEVLTSQLKTATKSRRAH